MTVTGLIALIALALVGRERTRGRAAWPWPATGLALGAVGTVAWLTGSIAGWGWGLSISGPSRSLIESTVLGLPTAGWGTAMVIGIPVGAWLSARARGPVAWRRPSWPELGRRLAGGALMGLGGTLAAGCNIGNALTGLSVLALNSMIASAAIVGGAVIAIAALGIGRAVPGFDMARDKP
jgi:hypothetical protein